MKSNVDLNTISDGRLYDRNDLVKADTDGCNGCNACCHGVGEFVVLNPFDVFELTRFLNTPLDALLEDRLELRSDGKLLLPHLRMRNGEEWCVFLNDEGRCAIHSCRPDICRLFPLGRVYEPDTFKYFLQPDACAKPILAKIKVKKWIGIPNTAEHDAFLLAWYYLVKALTFRVKFVRDADEMASINEFLLDVFYRIPIDSGDFYSEFFGRLPSAKDQLGII